MPRFFIGVEPSVPVCALPVRRRFLGDETPAERKVAVGSGNVRFWDREAEE
ncbi:hypothetical protein [Micromonospora sp. CA-248212]|uniref:hypothetical protein n=1 Tax=Micromonospora sp. CA-248212 TaxID=3239961 RepID=UPI003D91D506